MKSHQTEQVDVIMAACTASGLDLGECYAQVLTLHPTGIQATHLVFLSDQGRVWNSHYFGHTHIYPLLE